MPAPLAKGLIIAASVIVAAGLALYESPQVRQWVDQSRRKIAVALHSLGDEIDSPRRRCASEDPSSPDQEEEAERNRRRQDIVRRNRAELIRKAREEGVAVDLDELARLGTELHELQNPNRTRPGVNTADRTKSFDTLVRDDGTLKEEQATAARVTGVDKGQDQIHHRGRGIAAFQQGSQYANPFADDESQILLDRDLIGPEAPSASASQTIAPLEVVPQTSRESTATLAAEEVSKATVNESQNLIDVSTAASQIVPEATQTASIHSIPSQTSVYNSMASLPNAPLNTSAAAATTETSQYYLAQSPPSTPARSRSNTLQMFTPGDATPTEDGFSTASSVIGSHADDIANSLISLEHVDGYDDNASEAFSEVGGGPSTPGSWTDVGSDDESNFGSH